MFEKLILARVGEHVPDGQRLASILRTLTLTQARRSSEIGLPSGSKSLWLLEIHLTPGAGSRSMCGGRPAGERRPLTDTADVTGLAIETAMVALY